MSKELRILNEKLEFLQIERVKASDPTAIFKIQKDIEDVIDQIDVLNSGPAADPYDREPEDDKQPEVNKFSDGPWLPFRLISSSLRSRNRFTLAVLLGLLVLACVGSGILVVLDWEFGPHVLTPRDVRQKKEDLEQFVIEACASFTINRPPFCASHCDAFAITVDGATAEEHQFVEEALECLNACLPLDRRLSLGPNGRTTIHFATRFQIPEIYRRRHDQQIPANLDVAKFPTLATLLGHDDNLLRRFDGYIASELKDESKRQHICRVLLQSLGIGTLRKISRNPQSVLVTDSQTFTETDLILTRFFVEFVRTRDTEEEIRKAFRLYWDATREQLRDEGALSD